MIQWMCGIAWQPQVTDYGYWVAVLWYKSEHGYTPSADDAEERFYAKSSDAWINDEFPTHFGYNYYALYDAEADEKIFVKTRFDYDDLSRKFGWEHYQICYPDHKDDEWWECDWYEGHDGDRFDTEDHFGNDCKRWFTDYSGNPDCYGNPLTNGKRCFSTGYPCGDKPRKEVYMYKWWSSLPNGSAASAGVFGIDNAFSKDDLEHNYYSRDPDTDLELRSYAYYAFDILPEESTKCNLKPDHVKPTAQCAFQDTIHSSLEFVPYSIYAHKNVVLGGTSENSDHMWSTTCVMFADGSSYDTKDGRYCGHHQPDKWIHPNLVKGLARQGGWTNDPTTLENEKPAVGFHIITGEDKCKITNAGCLHGGGNCLVIYKGPEALIVNYQFRLSENCHDNYLQVGGVRYCGTGADDPLYAERKFPEYLRVEDGVTFFFRYAEPLDQNNRLPDGTYPLELCFTI